LKVFGSLPQKKFLIVFPLHNGYQATNIASRTHNIVNILSDLSSSEQKVHGLLQALNEGNFNSPEVKLDAMKLLRIAWKDLPWFTYKHVLAGHNPIFKDK
jgi:hypothetical protein